MPSDRFLSYFHRELTYLRNSGSVFASKHPKIARRLDWTKGESGDPHVERLLESFAFLSAKLHQDLDDRVPQIASGLLNVLYPQLVNPLPSVSVAHFEVDPTKARMTGGYIIPRHTELFSYAEENLIARFRTSFPLTLWPIHVVAADFVEGLSYTFKESVSRQAWYIRLRLKAQHMNFDNLNMDTLTFHLAGDRLSTISLYQGIFGKSHPHILYSLDGENLCALPPDALRPLGFDSEEQLFPAPSHSHPSYQVLQEYFHFPEKYLFFEIRHLLRAIQKNDRDIFEIFLPVAEERIVSQLNIGPEHFRLGCTPIVNLFEKTTDPLRITHRNVEYRITADSRLERTHEIHSIKTVHSVLDDGTVMEYAPYYSFEHRQNNALFWYMRRQSSDKRHIPGTDVYLSFVDTKFNPMNPPHETIYAKVLCTNRFLAEQLPAGASLQYDGRLPVTKMYCLDKPIAPAYPPTDGETLWKIVAQLSIHHLGYSDPSIALKVLKETLHLYANMTQAHVGAQIESITNFSTKEVVRRMPKREKDQAWLGFVKGIGVNVTIDEETDPSHMSFALAHILQHFLSMNVSIDSFVEMNLFSHQRKGVWMSWKPLNGHHSLL